MPTPALFHGGCGSSSLRECIELLNNTGRNAPATLHSGVKKEKTPYPPQVMGPSVDEKETTARTTASGSMPSGTPTVKDEPQTRTEQVKSEVPMPKLESPTLDVKEEVSEPETKEQLPDILPEGIQGNRETPPHDSEDSLSPECVADELMRLAETQAQSVSNAPNQSSEEGATASTSTWNRQGATAPDSSWDWENRGPYAPQRSGRYRGRTQSPDPFTFSSTVWINHDPEAKARMKIQ